MGSELFGQRISSFGPVALQRSLSQGCFATIAGNEIRYRT